MTSLSASKAHPPKLLIIGLDCMEPSLVFEQWRQDLPNLSRLMAQGSYGRLESSIPAITVPAWSCMMSGRDPGELGIYGFRNRVDRNYQNMAIADGRAVKVPRLWDIFGDAGWRVAVISVPGTFPPYPVNGSLISCFLTPSQEVPYTYPPELADQIATWMPDFMLDVPHFRSDEKDRILSNIYTLCDQRFSLAAKLMEQDSPDVLMLVDMGVDRIHHSFWKPMDNRHPQHIPNSPYANAIHDYYCHVDQQVGQLISQCGSETAVLIVSDHGARPLMGGICINEWLMQAGYLHLKEKPTSATSLDKLEVDWSQTKAWGAGGYYGRVFLNVKGREPQGVIPLASYEQDRSHLAEQLAAIPAPDGQPLGTKVFKPQQIYQKVRGIAPDLVVYFGDLAWRSIGTVGNGEIYTSDNDTGPDDANHAQYGLMIFHDPQQPQGGQQIAGAQLYDILPTLLSRYDLSLPSGLRGKVLPL
ncbi:MAG: alkaline phosphatase family protein [Drouetiella hepatica Uher 2000/2452]|jgi:predicted AlkP superfamily phosphohydrolase/phosphomutase|uniref:Alkaline phosphatase family protein n=1 Tax=Drouetiella hepatica Uher 2000/2452 TaxID=904376 RepID=A0A951QG67_9CYAN|nr:alkaline phosphatase family protein [Drouetiella hepatica Uher 2000/2452]